MITFSHRPIWGLVDRGLRHSPLHFDSHPISFFSLRRRVTSQQELSQTQVPESRSPKGTCHHGAGPKGSGGHCSRQLEREGPRHETLLCQFHTLGGQAEIGLGRCLRKQKELNCLEFVDVGKHRIKRVKRYRKIFIAFQIQNRIEFVDFCNSFGKLPSFMTFCLTDYK